MEKIQWLTLYVLVTGTLQDPGQEFLVVDKTDINEIHPFEDIPLVLLSAYFVFNIKYAIRCNNLFSLLKSFFLGFPETKHPLL